MERILFSSATCTAHVFRPSTSAALGPELDPDNLDDDQSRTIASAVRHHVAQASAVASRSIGARSETIADGVMMDIESDKLPPVPTSAHAQPLSLHALLQSSAIQESFVHLQQPSPNPVVPTHSPPFSKSPSLPKSSSSKRSHVMSESSKQGGSRQSAEASTGAGASSEASSKKRKSAIVGLPPPRS